MKDQFYFSNILFAAINSGMISILYKIKYKMDNCLTTGQEQPKDIPFKQSPGSQKYIGQRYQNANHLTILVICICFATFYYGYCLSFISAISLKTYGKFFGEWASEHSTYGWLIGCFPLGGAIGSAVARVLIKYFSRRKMLIICSVSAVIISGLLQINNIYLLLALRVMQGITAGNYMAVTPMFIKQITPLELRGSKGTFSQIMIVVGVVVCFFFKVVFNVTHTNQEFFWRFVFAFSGVLPLALLLLIIFGFIPQSPMSLILDGKMKQAKETIGLFHPKQVVNDVLAEMIHDSKQKQIKKIANENQNNEQMPKKRQPQKEQANLHEESSVRLEQPADQSGIKLPQIRGASRKLTAKQQQIYDKTMQLYQKDKNIEPAVQKILSDHHSQHEPVPQEQPKVSCKALALGFELHFMQQFSGIKMIITEVGVIFVKYNPAISLYIPLIANIVQLIASFFSSPIVARFGRKSITCFGNIALSINLLIIGVLFIIGDKTNNDSCIYAAVAFIVLFMVGYTTTIGPVVWLYVPQIIPHNYVPVASIFNWLASSICVIVTPYVLDAVGSPYPVFFFFGGVLFIFFLINMKYLIESKGLTPTQVTQKFNQ